MKTRRTYRQPAPTSPCDVCHRVHQNRCKPEDQRSVSVCVTLPVYVHRALVERHPHGSRSGWIARLIERELSA